jgi:hypothetical protein
LAKYDDTKRLTMMSKPAQVFLSLSLLMAFLIIGPAHLSAQPSTAIRRSLIPLETGSFDPLTNESNGPTEQRLIPQTRRPTTSLVHLTAAPQLSTGRAPSVTGPTSRSFDLLMSPLAGNAAFAVEVYPNERMRYIPNIDTPGEWEYVGDVEGAAYFAGDFVGHDFSQMYVIDYYLNELHTLGTTAAITTTIGACNPVSGQGWSGATGTADGILYASSTDESSSYLYTIDIDTGTATVVGQITNAPAIIDIAINADGEMYGVDIDGDNLVQIDPTTGVGTVIGSIGFDADYAQGMDFEQVSGVLYLAAYNATTSRGELRTANTTTGNSVLVGVFPEDAETDALAFTPPTTQRLQNPGFESGWAYWYTESFPSLSGTSHSGSWSVYLSGEECWVWQEVYIPSDAIDVSFGYWLTGISSDTEWDNDILIGGIWDQARQTKYVDVRQGLTYFYYNPMEWRNPIHRLEADELANVAGQRVLVGFQLTQDWNPGYHKLSYAYVDDAVLYVTRPIYDYSVYLPLVAR